MSAHRAGKAYAIGLMMGLMSKGLTYDEAADGSNLGRGWFKPLPQI